MKKKSINREAHNLISYDEFSKFMNLAARSFVRELNNKIVVSVDRLSEDTWLKENCAEAEKEDLFLRNIEFLDNVDLLGEDYLAKIQNLIDEIYSNSGANNRINSFVFNKKLNDNVRLIK